MRNVLNSGPCVMFERIDYAELNSRQKESYNFHKVSARLADYGYNSLLLNDDWQGADFIAVHVDGRFLKVQLKGRLTVDKKYAEKNIHIAFFYDDDLFVYDHDAFVSFLENNDRFGVNSVTWRNKGHWSWPSPPKWAVDYLEDYKVDP